MCLCLGFRIFKVTRSDALGLFSFTFVFQEKQCNYDDMLLQNEKQQVFQSQLRPEFA